MDIKWKKSRRVKFARLLLFMIIIGSLVVSFVNAREFILNHERNINIIFEQNYMNNSKYYNDRDELFSNLTSLILDYKNEANIKKGNVVTREHILNHDSTPYYSKFTASADYDDEKSDEENFKRFKELYPEEVERARKDTIKSQLNSFNTINKELGKLKNINYYATNGADVYTNNPSLKEEDYLKQPGYLVYDYENGIRRYPRDEKYRNYYGYDNVIESDDNNETKIYIGFSWEYFDKLEDDWKQEKEMAMDSLYRFLIPFGIMLLAFIIEVSILPNMEEEGRETLLDKPYTDISILISILALVMGFVFLSEGRFVDLWATVAGTIIIGAIGLFFVLSIVRNIKNRRFLSHSLIGKVLITLKSFFLAIYKGSSLERRVAILLILYPILIAVTIFVFPITIGLVIWLALKKTRDFIKIKDGVKKVKNGDLSHKIEIEKNGEFKDLAEDINSISEGLDQAIDNELKSERHKAELITNVSHDIRTPLTSIITYIDLLKNEEDEDKCREYIEVLDAKSTRLKTLTDNLFEASKVSSGSIPVNLSNIDVVSLITQGLGEVNDKIEENNLEFIIDADRPEMNVIGDGELLWRAIENLLSNIFKYSLKGSRIYIDIRDTGNNISIMMKNISAYKLNISAEELMERFKRGDESRSSEGSGLGLSIAESLIDIQNGHFELEIDGDLFKTNIILPKSK